MIRAVIEYQAKSGSLKRPLNKPNLTKPPVTKDELKFNLYRHIAENPDQLQHELAAELGASLGSINYCSKAFIDVGWVEMGGFVRSQDKRSCADLLTSSGFAEKTKLTLRFLKRKQNEYELLKLEIATVRSELLESIVK